MRAENGDDRISRLTQDEQKSLMSLFVIFRSPLMFGGDLPSSDEFTLSLLTSKEILFINQFSRNNRQLFRHGDLIAWTADDPKTGDKYLALFNAQDQEQIIENKALWKSEVISALNKKHSVDIDVGISNSKKLYLVVADAGNGNNWDHADWIEPELTGVKGNLSLTELKWINATAGWGQAAKNKSVGGNTLNVDGKDYLIGIGTHSISIIEFDIPEGYNRFTAKAGLDKECIEHTEGASVQFFVYTQDPSGPLPADSVSVPVTLKEFGLHGTCRIKDLWNKKDLGYFNIEFAPFIKRHGAELYKISVIK